MNLWVNVRSIKVKLYIHMYFWVYIRSNKLLNVKFFSLKKNRKNETYTVLIFKYQAIYGYGEWSLIFLDIIARQVIIFFTLD